MNEYELYLWDLTGYLIVKNVLTVDELETIEKALTQLTGKLSANSTIIKSHELPELLKPNFEVCRQLLIHPAVIKRLYMMCGKGFRLDYGPSLICNTNADYTWSLHGAGEPYRPGIAYHYQNGISNCDSVTVAWLLTDIKTDEGGFTCIPGSHKSNFSLPQRIQMGKEQDLIVKPCLEAGDLLFLMDGALTHSLYPQRATKPYQAITFVYTPRSVMLHAPSNDMFLPDNWWNNETLLDGMTEEQLTVMYGPGIYHNGIVKSLVVDENGGVRIVE